MPGRETKQHKKENKEKAVREVTAAERTALKRHIARLEGKPSVRLEVSKNGNNPQIELDHPDKLVAWALVMDAFASTDRDFVNGIVDQLAKASGHGEDISEQRINFMLSVIKNY